MKRGQAALEFLTTYGWAFIVVLVMVGALSHFGVLNPANLAPERCVSPAGFECKDSQVLTEGQSIRFSNKLGHTIQISNASIETKSGVASCTSYPSVVGADQEFTLVCDKSDLADGKKTKMDVSFNYFRPESGSAFAKGVSSQVISMVSQGSVSGVDGSGNGNGGSGNGNGGSGNGAGNSGSTPPPVNYSSLQQGLVARWTFDEEQGLTAQDSSQNGFNLVINQALGEIISGSTCKKGGCLYAMNENGGATGYISSGSLDSMFGDRQRFSISFFYKLNSDTDSSNTHIKLGNDFYFRMRPSHSIGFNHMSGVVWALFRIQQNTAGGHSWWNSTAGITCEPGCGSPQYQWSHVVFTYDNGAMKFYRNGYLIRQGSPLTFVPEWGDPNLLPLTRLENPFDSITIADSFGGYMDEIRIYNRVLTATEAYNVYHYDSFLQEAQSGE